MASTKVPGVISGGNENKRSNNGDREGIGLANMGYWEKDFDEMSWYNKVEEVLKIPPISDMAGVFSRTNFKNDRERVAAVRLFYRNKKFHDDNHQEMLRADLASRLGIGGLGNLHGLFAATNLIAPDMERAARGLPKTKNGEEKVHRGSDFREERDNPKERD